MYSVYGLQDPRDMLIHYIGIAKDPYRRYAMHLLIGGKTEKDAWIRKLRELNLSPLLVILETVETKDIAEEREYYWLDYYFTQNAPLTNVSKMMKYKPRPRTSNGLKLEVPQSSNSTSAFHDVDIAKQFISTQGWTPRVLPRRKGKLYLYAARRAGKRIVWRYIAPVARLEQMTQDQVLARLQKME